jgi:shikimate kinase
MKIILLGYMGSGKSAVGNALLRKSGLPFKDLDEEISRREKRSITEIFKSSGEIYFRKKESEVLEELVNSKEDFVLSLGGGTPCYGKNLQLLQQNTETALIYLKTNLDELTNRLFAEREKRPLIAHLDSRELLEDFIRKHLFERTYYYNQSDLIFTTDEKTPDDLAQEILNSLD